MKYLKTGILFSDHMVFQQDKPMIVWGTAKADAPVLVGIGNNRVLVNADAMGNWQAELPALSATRGLTLKIESKLEQLIFEDVCVGEVWIAGGQSNMEYLLGFEEHFEQVQKTERSTKIRFFNTPQIANERQLEELEFSNDGFWRTCTEEDLGWFSAVGYYFSKELQESLDVPVGIIGCNWGGTNCCTWMDPDYVIGTKGECWLEMEKREYGNLSEEEAYADFAKGDGYDRTDMLHEEFGNIGVKVSLSLEEQKKMMEAQGDMEFPELPYERRPGRLYRTMVKRLTPFNVRGAIWYQGESDAGHPREYVDVFSGLIRNWRDLWGAEMPFIFAQLAPFHRWLGCTDDGYVEVRESQEWVSKSMPNCWMASNGDAGMEWDIHPKNKIPVGHRMALLARAHVYGEDLLSDAPEVKEVVKNGKELIISFVNGRGLYLKGDSVNALVCKSADGKEVALEGVAVDGERLRLTVDASVNRIELGKTGYYQLNLYNEMDIPVLPFSITI